MISVHEFSEFWIIDHSTTTAEAAGHTGGRAGQGRRPALSLGQSPRLPRRAPRPTRRSSPSTTPTGSPAACPGAGHLLVFNNGGHRPDGNYSSVDELVLPVERPGAVRAGARKGATGPRKPVWSYSAPKKSDFYAFFISGAHRLPNGNTLICSGPNGTLFEVTPDKEVVWKYVNPVKGGFGPGGFGPGPGGPPRPNQVLVSFLQDMLGLSADQKKEIDALQKTVDETLDKSLTDAQKKTLRERSAPGPGGFAAMPAPGQIMSVVDPGGPEADPRAEDAARGPPEGGRCRARQGPHRRSEEAAQADAGRFPPGGPPGGPGGGGPPGGPGGPGGGPPAFLFAGPPGGSAVFRAYRYGPDYPGLAGKDLKPGKTVEELQPKEPEKTKDSAKAKEPAKK